MESLGKKFPDSAYVVGNNSSRTSPSKQSRTEVASYESYSTAIDHGIKSVDQTGFLMDQKHANMEKSEFMCQNYLAESSQKQVSGWESKLCIKRPVDDSKTHNSSSLLESTDPGLGQCKVGVGQLNSQFTPQSEITSCPNPQNSFYSTTQYAEAKQSFTVTEVSECTSGVEKSGEVGDEFTESRNTSIYRESTGSDLSDESNSSSSSNAMYKPHKANDIGWEAIKAVRPCDGMVELNHFRELKKLGEGDVGTVFLSELVGTRTYYAIKVMDKAALES